MTELITVKDEQLPVLLNWLERHLPHSWKLYGTVREQLRGTWEGIPYVALVNKEWPNIVAVGEGWIDVQRCKCPDYFLDPRRTAIFAPDKESTRALLTWPGFIDWNKPCIFQEVVLGDKVTMHCFPAFLFALVGLFATAKGGCHDEVCPGYFHAGGELYYWSTGTLHNITVAKHYCKATGGTLVEKPPSTLIALAKDNWFRDAQARNTWFWLGYVRRGGFASRWYYTTSGQKVPEHVTLMHNKNLNPACAFFQPYHNQNYYITSNKCSHLGDNYPALCTKNKRG